MPLILPDNEAVDAWLGCAASTYPAKSQGDREAGACQEKGDWPQSRKPLGPDEIAYLLSPYGYVLASLTDFELQVQHDLCSATGVTISSGTK